jgi:transposase-like protein
MPAQLRSVIVERRLQPVLSGVVECDEVYSSPAIKGIPRPYKKSEKDAADEGFWSLLRSWLRPHRGISRERLPVYPGFFESVHNVRKRGNAVLGSLLALLPT